MPSKQDWTGADNPAFCAMCGQPAPPEVLRCPTCRKLIRLPKDLHVWTLFVVTVAVFIIRIALGTYPYMAAIVSGIAGLGAMTFIWLILRKKLWPFAHGWRNTWKASVLAGIAITEGGVLPCLPRTISPDEFAAIAILLLPMGLIIGLIIPLVGPHHAVNLMFRDCPSCGAAAGVRMRHCWRCGRLLPETSMTARASGVR